MGRRYVLSTFHPASVLIYLTAVVVMSICISVPEFTLASILFGSICDALLNGRSSCRILGGLVALCLLMSLLSPLFNPIGDTVLFTYLGDRPYTLEAIAYGASVASMFAAMMIWFHVAASLLDSQKMLYLFSRSFPKLGLVIASAMMLLPRFWRRLGDLEAQRGAGDPSGKDGLTSHVKVATMRIFNLCRWSFDEGMRRSVAMKSRGFATGPTTTYQRYCFTLKDVLLVVASTALVAMTIALLSSASASFSYFPYIKHSGYSVDVLLALLAFSVLLAIPATLTVWGWAHWRCCASRI